MGKHLGPQYHVFNDITRPDTSDSDDDKSELRHTLLFWEAFRAQSTKRVSERNTWPRVETWVW
jgi:hypothetical protein